MGTYAVDWPTTTGAVCIFRLSAAQLQLLGGDQW
jgi:hypothetical protein